MLPETLFNCKINLNLEIINIFWLSEYNILQIK